MAVARIVSYGSYTVDQNVFTASIPWDALRGGWRHAVATRTRPGQRSALLTTAPTERRITADFVPAPGISSPALEVFADTLIGALNPFDPTPRLLVLQRPDGVNVQVSAVIEMPYAVAEDDTVDTIRVVFVTADPVWRRTTSDTYGPTAAGFGTEVSNNVTVNGYAVASPFITIAPTAQDPNAQYKFRRTFTVTNNGIKTWRKEPIRLDLGSTAAGWAGGAMNAAQTHLYLDGVQQRRELIGAGLAQSYLWFVVDHLPPGQTLTYELVYNSPSVTARVLAGTDWQPAFDISSENGNVAAGSTSTTMVTANAWEVNRWADGDVRILTGTGAGQTRSISSNTATTLTIGSAWTTTPDATSTYLITMSRNDLWIYATRQTERNVTLQGRGLYRINRDQSKPSHASSDVPGGWFSYSYLRNRDERNQETGGTAVNVGTVDYFSILDADRTWQDGSQLKDSGLADGMSFASARAITSWKFDGLFKNPNGIGHAFFGSREAGALGWEQLRDVTTAADTLTAFSVATQTPAADTYQLVCALLPYNDAEIPPDWPRDDGTVSAATSTTLTDATKEWASGQFVNAMVRIISGTGSGQSRTVTASTATQLTVAAWTTTPDTSSRYEVVNKRLVATLRNNTTFVLGLSATPISLGALSTEGVNYYFLNMSVRAGGGSPVPVAPFKSITNIVARRLFLAAGQEVRIDCANRRASVYAGSTFVRDVTAQMFVADVPSAGVFRLAQDWMLLNPGTTAFFFYADYVTANYTVVVTPGYFA